MSITLPPNRPELDPVPLASSTRRHSEPPPLPRSLSPLVGREREIAAVALLLSDPDLRLLTLTGPGGVGKTRLALAVAAQVAAGFDDGVRFVPLATVTDPTLVGTAIAHALGVREAGDAPPGQRLRAILGAQHLLLVLDNFEQVVAAATLVADLLTWCPRVRVLVTSRGRLRVSREREYAVPPLGLAEQDASAAADGGSEFGAVRLFVERARMARSDFALTTDNAPSVAAICRRLDGLPLAIELAAARVRVLSPPALLARLERRLPLLTGGPRDAPARQRTMRDAIAWSHDLLAADERALFRRLAVFVGGFTLEDAEAVGGAAGEPPPDLLEGLTALVDGSLVRRVDRNGDAPRFALLETVREYGLERLDASGEAAAIRDRHAAHVLALAEEAEANLFGPEGRDWLARLELAHGDLRAALVWATASGAASGVLRLAGALWRFWYAHGHHSEGRAWLRAALAAAGADQPLSRAKASAGAALLEHCGGDDATALARGEESLALCRRHGDGSGTAVALYVLGKIAEASGEYDQAEARFDEALTLFRAEGDPIWTGLALDHLGSVAYGRGQHERAQTLLAEALTSQRSTGHGYGAAVSLLYLGHLAQAEGDRVAAAGRYGESLALWREEEFRPGIAEVLSGLAAVAGASGTPVRAARLFGAAETTRQTMGLPARLPERALYDRTLAGVRRDLGPDGFAAAWEAGQAMPIEQALAEGAALAAELTGSGGAPSGIEAGAARSPSSLTPRERDVLGLIVEGRSDREIADALFVSPRTASTHVAAILAKFGVPSRAAATAHALRHGLA